MPYASKERKREAARHWMKTRPESSRQKQRERKKGYTARNKAIVVEAKSQPCTDCRLSFHPICMDFDHLPQHEKKMDVAKLITYSEAVLRAEIAKCEVVCSNCHRLRTLNRSNWKR